MKLISVLIIFINLFPSLIFATEKSCQNLFKEFTGSKEISADDTVVFNNSISDFFINKRVISVLGSSRISEGHPTYDLTYQIAYTLGEKGFSILTGGGPGIMDAANKAAFHVGAESIGLEVNSPWPRHPTSFINMLFIFNDLQIRKKVFLSVSDAWIVMPGGLGSLDEVFSIIGAIYSGQIPKKPVILVDSKFWQPLLSYIQTTLVAEYKTAKPTDLDFIHLLDTPQEVTDVISKSSIP